MTDRRTFLTRVALAGIGLAAAATAGSGVARAAGAPCFDPAALSLSQRNRRRALGYVDASTEAGKHCGGCAFFTGDAKACGTCQILSGGPVSGAGLCSSFAPRAG